MLGVVLTPEIRLKRIQNFINRLPVLSTTVTKVLEICNRPDTSPNDLNRVISLDPVLTGQVLKLINSAYYALPNQINSLTRAIIMLGLNTVKNLALSAAVLGVMGNKDAYRSLSADKFWAHSIGVGVTAKALAVAREIPFAEREEFFVAGLLHDLGKVTLNGCFPEEYRNVLVKTQDEMLGLRAEEELLFGFDHCVVGRMIVEKWQLSETIVECLAWHHDPAQAKEKHRILVAAVGLANMYVNTSDIGSAGDPYPDKGEIDKLLDILGFEWEQVAALGDTVHEEIEKAQMFLQVSRG